MRFEQAEKTEFHMADIAFSRKLIAVLGSLVVLLALLMAAPSAQAGSMATVQGGKRVWFFEGATFDWNSGDYSDPLNLAFLSPLQNYSASEIADKIIDIRDEYEDGVSQSDQGLYFLNPFTRKAHKRKQDKAIATEKAPINRRHMRIWGDETIANMLHRDDNQWGVGGVHGETLQCVSYTTIFGKKVCNKPPKHKITEDWDKSRIDFALDMKHGDDGGRCVLAHWRRHPGAAGWFGDSSNKDWYHYSTGYLARITFVKRTWGCKRF